MTSEQQEQQQQDYDELWRHDACSGFALTIQTEDDESIPGLVHATSTLSQDSIKSFTTNDNLLEPFVARRPLFDEDDEEQPKKQRWSFRRSQSTPMPTNPSRRNNVAQFLQRFNKSSSNVVSSLSPSDNTDDSVRQQQVEQQTPITTIANKKDEELVQEMANELGLESPKFDGPGILKVLVQQPSVIAKEEVGEDLLSLLEPDQQDDVSASSDKKFPRSESTKLALRPNSKRPAVKQFLKRFSKPSPSLLREALDATKQVQIDDDVGTPPIAVKDEELQASLSPKLGSPTTAEASQSSEVEKVPAIATKEREGAPSVPGHAQHDVGSSPEDEEETNKSRRPAQPNRRPNNNVAQFLKRFSSRELQASPSEQQNELDTQQSSEVETPPSSPKEDKDIASPLELDQQGVAHIISENERTFLGRSQSTATFMTAPQNRRPNNVAQFLKRFSKSSSSLQTTTQVSLFSLSQLAAAAKQDEVQEKLTNEKFSAKATKDEADRPVASPSFRFELVNPAQDLVPTLPQLPHRWSGNEEDHDSSSSSLPKLQQDNVGTGVEVNIEDESWKDDILAQLLSSIADDQHSSSFLLIHPDDQHLIKLQVSHHDQSKTSSAAFRCNISLWQDILQCYQFVIPGRDDGGGLMSISPFELLLLVNALPHYRLFASWWSTLLAMEDEVVLFGQIYQPTAVQQNYHRLREPPCDYATCQPMTKTASSINVESMELFGEQIRLLKSHRRRWTMLAIMLTAILFPASITMSPVPTDHKDSVVINANDSFVDDNKGDVDQAVLNPPAASIATAVNAHEADPTAIKRNVSITANVVDTTEISIQDSSVVGKGAVEQVSVLLDTTATSVVVRESCNSVVAHDTDTNRTGPLSTEGGYNSTTTAAESTSAMGITYRQQQSTPRQAETSNLVGSSPGIATTSTRHDNGAALEYTVCHENDENASANGESEKRNHHQVAATGAVLTIDGKADESDDKTNETTSITNNRIRLTDVATKRAPELLFSTTFFDEVALLPKHQTIITTPSQGVSEKSVTAEEESCFSDHDVIKASPTLDGARHYNVEPNITIKAPSPKSSMQSFAFGFDKILSQDGTIKSNKAGVVPDEYSIEFGKQSASASLESAILAPVPPSVDELGGATNSEQSGLASQDADSGRITRVPASDGFNGRTKPARSMKESLFAGCSNPTNVQMKASILGPEHCAAAFVRSTKRRRPTKFTFEKEKSPITREGRISNIAFVAKMFSMAVVSPVVLHVIFRSGSATIVPAYTVAALATISIVQGISQGMKYLKRLIRRPQKDKIV